MKKSSNFGCRCLWLNCKRPPCVGRRSYVLEIGQLPVAVAGSVLHLIRRRIMFAVTHDGFFYFFLRLHRTKIYSKYQLLILCHQARIFQSAISTTNLYPRGFGLTLLTSEATVLLFIRHHKQAPNQRLLDENNIENASLICTCRWVPGRPDGISGVVSFQESTSWLKQARPLHQVVPFPWLQPVLTPISTLCHPSNEWPTYRLALGPPLTHVNLYNLSQRLNKKRTKKLWKIVTHITKLSNVPHITDDREANTTVESKSEHCKRIFNGSHATLKITASAEAHR